jgi:mRNA-degrading endonuclease toxin of MazEF toxin-antitoxin module
MKYLLQTISAVAAGAAAMYYLDPEQGKRRRALVRDKVVSVSHDAADVAQAKSRHVANRMKGLAAEGGSHFRSSAPVSPKRIHQRVRACLGRVTTHPKAVHVDVLDEGEVRLSGHILAGEIDTVLSEVGAVDGVKHVHSDLMIHETAGNIPQLQGGGRSGNGASRRSLLWPALAMAAPIALIAAAARPRHRPLVERMAALARPRRKSLMERLTATADQLPLPRALTGQKRDLRRYLSAFRAS